MKELERAGAKFEEDAAQEHLMDITSDLLQITAQSIGETLPGIGVIFKIGKAAHSIRDYATMEKVLAFFYQLSSMDKKKRLSLIKKINEDPIYGQKFGTFLLTAIDRHDFKEKSVYLATACKFYERGDMSKNNFIRIKTMIESNDLMDLEEWMSPNNYRLGDKNIIPPLAIQKFLSTGIISQNYNFDAISGSRIEKSVRVTNRIRTQDVIKYKLTSLGNLLLSILLDKEISEIDASIWRLNGDEGFN